MPPEDRIRVTVILRRPKSKAPAAVEKKVNAIKARGPRRRVPLSRADLEELNAAVLAHRPLIEKFARAHGLEVVRFSTATPDVVLEGSVAAVNRAFGVELERCEHEGRDFFSHLGEVLLPEELSSVVEDVLGLDETPIARRHAAAGTATTSTSFTPPELVEHYRFPAGADGAGQRIAVLEFGGGFYDSDLSAYWDLLGLKSRPEVRVHSVDGATNAPMPYDDLADIMKSWNQGLSFDEMSAKYGNDFSSASYVLEVTGDIEVAGAVASGGGVDVYFAPNSRRGWYDAINAALGLGADAGSAEDAPTALSISWGVSEPDAGKFMDTVQGALENADLRGVAVCCSSGDWGSRNSSTADAAEASVGFPQSSPYALACGGTQFDDAQDGSRVEVVWNRDNRGNQQATGGGVSGRFEVPDFQADASVPAHGELNGPAWISSEHDSSTFRGRGVPDVAALADTLNGYQILVGGEQTVIGGTSLATPLWAGLLACLSQELGQPVRWIQHYIYRESFRGAFRDADGGHNELPNSQSIAYFEARAGDWDGCCGLGVPDGEKLLESLRQAMDAEGDS